MVNADVQRAECLQEREELFLFFFHWKIWTIYRLHKMSINLEFTDLLLLPGGIYGISRGTFFQGIEIVALTAVRATI